MTGEAHGFCAPPTRPSRCSRSLGAGFLPRATGSPGNRANTSARRLLAEGRAGCEPAAGRPLRRSSGRAGSARSQLNGPANARAVHPAELRRLALRHERDPGVDMAGRSGLRSSRVGLGALPRDALVASLLPAPASSLLVATSEALGDVGSSHVAAVVPEYRVFMNAGHVPTAISGRSRDPRFREQVSGRCAAQTSFARGAGDRFCLSSSLRAGDRIGDQAITRVGDPGRSQRHEAVGISVLSAGFKTLLGMARDFVSCERGQLLLMPPSVRDWLPEDHLVWTVMAAVDQMDLAVLCGVSADGSRRAAYDPSMMA